MENFMESMGYNCPDLGWKAQLKMLGQLLVIGAIVSVPMIVIMAIAGWLENLCQ